MSKYTEFIQEAAKNRGGNYSKGSFVELAGAMFNYAPTFTVYSRKGNSFVKNEVNPGNAIRNGLIAPILSKYFGIDKSELGKLAEAQTGKSGAEALADFSQMLVKEYLDSKAIGRKLVLPMTREDDSIMRLSTRTVPTETRATSMILKQKDGSYTTQPTGKTIKTEQHEKLVATNSVPDWLRSEV